MTTYRCTVLAIALVTTACGRTATTDGSSQVATSVTTGAAAIKPAEVTGAFYTDRAAGATVVFMGVVSAEMPNLAITYHTDKTRNQTQLALRQTMLTRDGDNWTVMFVNDVESSAFTFRGEAATGKITLVGVLWRGQTIGAGDFKGEGGGAPLNGVECDFFSGFGCAP